jgi:hypothetical protein
MAMKEDELDDLLKNALKKEHAGLVTPKEETSSRWRINQEMVIRWSVIGAFTLAAILIVYFSGGIDRLAESLVKLIAEVQSWLKKF